MPGTLVPAQSFDHELNPVKGWPSPYALDKSAPAGSGVTGIAPGMVVSLNSVEKWKRGCANGEMPCFAFPGQNDFDVNGDVGNIIGNNLMALVATGGYELESTEYMGAGFGVNVPLTAHNTADADQGKLKVTTLGSSDMIVGICSKAAPFMNDFRKNVLRFWPVFLPKR
jgi:hypothetical protein